LGGDNDQPIEYNQSVARNTIPKEPLEAGMFRFLSCRGGLSLLLFAAFVFSLIAADEPKKVAPTKEQITQWIRDLGDDDFDKRENASKQLWEAGQLAETALKESLKSNDLEVKRRSRELLDKFKWGIYPATPVKIVEMIQRYQAGANPDAKGAIVLELLDEGKDGRTAFTKISAAEDKELLETVRGVANVVFFNRGTEWYAKKDYDHALKDYDEAIRLNPKNANAFHNRAATWYAKKDYDHALKDYDEAIRLNPIFAGSFTNRGNVWGAKKVYDKAIKDYDEAIRLNPKNVIALNNNAWFLAVCPGKRYRDGKKALELATRACELTEWKAPVLFDSLAAAYAETGDFDKAVEWVEKALKDAEYEKEFGDAARERLKLFKDKKPFRKK
jgi:tetratricopeptide (TPR) repeat protein